MVRKRIKVRVKPKSDFKLYVIFIVLAFAVAFLIKNITHKTPILAKNVRRSIIKKVVHQAAQSDEIQKDEDYQSLSDPEK